jgi:hypothetical protein
MRNASEIQYMSLGHFPYLDLMLFCVLVQLLSEKLNAFYRDVRLLSNNVDKNQVWQQRRRKNKPEDT